MSPRRSLTASLQVRANYSGILLRDYNADPGLRGASRVARASQPSRANSNSLLGGAHHPTTRRGARRRHRCW